MYGKHCVYVTARGSPLAARREFIIVLAFVSFVFALGTLSDQHLKCTNSCSDIHLISCASRSALILTLWCSILKSKVHRKERREFFRVAFGVFVGMWYKAESLRD